MTFRFMASRHSAFYSPLLYTVVKLREQGHAASYGVLRPGQKTFELLRDGAVDVMQSAVSSNWALIDRGAGPLPVHFAQINRRDGFFLVGRDADPAFEWKKLEGRTLAADTGLQPLAMLKYAVRHSGADWSKIRVVERGPADYLHLQAPVVEGPIVASVGASMPPVAFSSLCCAREYQSTREYRHMLEIFAQAKEWVRTSPPAEVAARESEFFADVPEGAVIDAVARYQAMGCWDGGVEIPRQLYEQAVDVFLAVGAISRRYEFQEMQLLGCI